VSRGVLSLAAAADAATALQLESRARWFSVPADAVLSHETAALLHGLPWLAVPESPGFLIPRTARGAVADARLGALPREHVTRLHGVPVTTLPRTVVDLLRCADDALAAQVVADSAYRLGVDAAAVGEVLAFCVGWPGIRQAREAWAHRDARAESPLESRHRALFRRLDLPEPELQVVIRDELGAFVARVDFLFREQDTVVESDGRLKYQGDGIEGPREAATRNALWQEKRREDRIRDLGLEVVRATWADSEDGGADLDRRIRRAFTRAARRRAA
jgi:hypothetical protein